MLNFNVILDVFSIFDSNTTFVNVKLQRFSILALLKLHSNTTFVNVKQKEINSHWSKIIIQIQLLLMLNPSRCALWQILIIIQIQLLLMLNPCKYWVSCF